MNQMIEELQIIFLKILNIFLPPCVKIFAKKHPKLLFFYYHNNNKKFKTMGNTGGSKSITLMQTSFLLIGAAVKSLLSFMKMQVRACASFLTSDKTADENA